jgi:hypothetical protein
MKTNDILEDIYRIREEHARECGFDVDLMFAQMKQELCRLKSEGWKIVAPGPREVETCCVMREDPPKNPN